MSVYWTENTEVILHWLICHTYNKHRANKHKNRANKDREKNMLSREENNTENKYMDFCCCFSKSPTTKSIQQIQEDQDSLTSAFYSVFFFTSHNLQNFSKLPALLCRDTIYKGQLSVLESHWTQTWTLEDMTWTKTYLIFLPLHLQYQSVGSTSIS